MLSTKDQIVTKTAIDTGYPEELVDQVVMWVSKDANEHMRTCKSVEISGFGTFKVSPYRVRSRVELMDKTLRVLETTPNEKKRQSALKTKKYYETKL
jgi:hypothetical protein